MVEIIKKGAWSPEEDQKLKSYIMRYGIWNWSHMPKFAGLSRTGKSCRLRWMNYLRPDVKRGPFTMEEVEIVIKTYEELGNRWSAIAAKLPGRTDNEIKNFFHTHLKRHLGVKNDASMKSTRARSNKRLPKKAEQNEITNANKPSTDVCNSSENSNITWEENQMMDVLMNLSQTHCYDVVDQPIINMEISPVILESNPETATGINCQLCQFEYPHPCTISDGASFDIFDQFDLLWDSEHLIF
ncbi:hypothetical protein K7X08_035549 [Anisodus acutangulus]|uniref:Uncharacterized protein n=1 Tax=Anisodus acutangulus TaxID=402998 RepID=A0A9Q1LHM2_9SOLA|nr:hypothetical protein K7X08_035549 [Anisodus acutangulus]